MYVCILWQSLAKFLENKLITQPNYIIYMYESFKSEKLPNIPLHFTSKNILLQYFCQSFQKQAIANLFIIHYHYIVIVKAIVDSYMFYRSNGTFRVLQVKCDVCCISAQLVLPHTTQDSSDLSCVIGRDPHVINECILVARR